MRKRTPDLRRMGRQDHSTLLLGGTYYHHQRDKGSSHQTAVRVLVFVGPDPQSLLAAAYSSRSKAQFEKYRHLLGDEEEGVEKVIRALCHLRDAHPRKKKLSTELAYFRRYRHRIRYAKARAQNLPIGSGVVEAACKTLATERMNAQGCVGAIPGAKPS